MSNNLEIEYKTLLTKEEYLKLSQKYKAYPNFQQTNYYFDTLRFDLKSHKMSLRIRMFNDKAEMTLKVPQQVGNQEYNVNLSIQEAKEIISSHHFPNNQITTMIEAENIAINDIKYFGHLTTNRREVRLPIGLLAIDHNQYSTIQDYELELEVSDAKQGQLDFNQFLETEKISFKYAKSKVARFSQTLSK